MTDTFLVAVDGSEAGTRALAFAKMRAKAGKARVVLAHVIEWSPYSFHTPEELAERHKRREEELARAETSVLSPLAVALKGEGIKFETVVRHGHIAETLVTLAAEHKAAQIFVGRRGHSRVKALLFGSVAATLVQISSVPVTVVP